MYAVLQDGNNCPQQPPYPHRPGYPQQPSYPVVYDPMQFGHAVPTHNTVTNEDEWDTAFKDKNCRKQLFCLIIGVVLTAIAGIAAYFCLVHGLQMLDMASTSLSRFGSGFLIYSGVVFSFVAVGNALYTGGKLVFNDKHKTFKYSPTDAKMQIAVSIFSPVAAIPAVIVLGLCMAGGGKC